MPTLSPPRSRTGVTVDPRIPLPALPRDVLATAAGWVQRATGVPAWASLSSLTAGLLTLIGFPFDFLWHELFGEDVTLWGPSHLQLIGGGALGVLGFVILAYEARRLPGWRPTVAGRFLMACGVVAGPTVMS